MRILLINYELPPIGAGAGNATANIARGLAAAGDEVTVLTSRFAGLAAEERRDGYLIRRVPALRRRADRSTPFEMLTFVAGGLAPALAIGASFRPDVACAFFGLPSGPLALALARFHGVPYLVSLRGGDVPGFLSADLGRLHRLTAPAIRAIWRHSAGLIANSEGLADLARQTWPEAPIVVIPNGVDIDRFSPPPRRRPAETARLLSVGRLVRQKGTRHAIEALARLRNTAELRVVGDGPERRVLEELARNLGVGDRVTFVGWAAREELPAHYGWADVFVLPSFEEGMANVLLEALAAGLPIVTTGVYGNRDLVAAGVNGFLVPPADTTAIAEALNCILSDPERFRRMESASRARALGRGWSAVAGGYRDELTRVILAGATARGAR